MDSTSSDSEELTVFEWEQHDGEGSSNNDHHCLEEFRPEEGAILMPYMYEPNAPVPVSRTDDEACEVAPSVVQHRRQDHGDRMETLNWCTCGHCVGMPTFRECICCHEIPQVNERRMRDNPPPVCITLKRGFQSVCLDVDVLETAFYQFKQQYREDLNAGQSQEKCRYFAYRQLVRWCWGYLGRDVRVILPACAVKKIREQFSAAGNYVGFKFPGE